MQDDCMESIMESLLKFKVSPIVGSYKISSESTLRFNAKWKNIQSILYIAKTFPDFVTDWLNQKSIELNVSVPLDLIGGFFLK